MFNHVRINDETLQLFLIKITYNDNIEEVIPKQTTLNTYHEDFTKIFNTLATLKNNLSMSISVSDATASISQKETIEHKGYIYNTTTSTSTILYTLSLIKINKLLNTFTTETSTQVSNKSDTDTSDDTSDDSSSLEEPKFYKQVNLPDNYNQYYDPHNPYIPYDPCYNYCDTAGNSYDDQYQCYEHFNKDTNEDTDKDTNKNTNEDIKELDYEFSNTLWHTTIPMSTSSQNIDSNHATYLI